MHQARIEVALNHHERLDGKGYAVGLTSLQFQPFTRMVSIADVYDAMPVTGSIKQAEPS